MRNTMRSRSMLAAAMTMATLCGNEGTAHAQSASDLSKRAFELVNKHRKDKGKSQLRVQSTLALIAQKYAETMARLDQGGHDLDGTTKDRVVKSGYQYVTFGENVQRNWGHADPAKSAVDWWINSPGHHANMLDSDFTEAGMGASKSKSGKWCFCQVFARPLSEAIVVKVKFTNTTSYTISYNVGKNNYTLAPGYHRSHERKTVNGKVQYGVEWPETSSGGLGTGGAEVGILKNNRRYEFRRKNGDFSLVNVGAL